MHQTLRKQYTCKRKLLDKYYTKQDVVAKCLKTLRCLNYHYDLVIEPSAGAGAFYHAINHKNKIGMDLEPEHQDLLKANWLDYRVDPRCQSVLVIGNPPFGRYHRLSVQFIIHALCFHNVQTIAFVLPNVYKKHTRQKILPRDWRIVSIVDLGSNAFTLGGQDYHIPSSFFIFDKSFGEDLRADPFKYQETPDFAFGNKDDYDLFVFGASPRHITYHPQPNNRGYFLKARIPTDALIKKIRSVNWQGNSCASGGVYWLTKSEFLEQYISHHQLHDKTRDSCRQ